MKHTLIIPTYNEAPIIHETLQTLLAAFDEDGDHEWDIIVVDNGSHDGTLAAVASLQDSRVRSLCLKEKGKGRAIRAGFAEAQGDIVGFTDADLSIAPQEIINAFYRISGGASDLVIGSRLHPESMMPDREWWRIGSSRFFNILAHAIVGVHSTDSQCPLKVLNKEAQAIILTTEENTWFFDLEFLAHAEMLGLVIEEIPVRWNEHYYPERQSKLSTITDGFRAIIAMIRMRKRVPSRISFHTEKDIKI